MLFYVWLILNPLEGTSSTKYRTQRYFTYKRNQLIHFGEASLVRYTLLDYSRQT